jgi:succinate-semialdehyde dehydrogenase/glutarate-semialdehyde dehydrogenase
MTAHKKITPTPAPADTFGGLLRDKAYIGGKWAAAERGALFSVVDPASGDWLADVPDMGAAEAEKAVAAAKAAFPAWKALTAKERANILRRWFDLMVACADDLAALLTAEQGKPLAEAKGEILYGASFIEWFAEEGKRVYGDTIPTHKKGSRVLVTRQPVGVVSAITPWNFPNAMITRKVGPALAAGCTIVLKPAEDTPLSALALAALAEKAGLPAGVFNIVTCDAENAPAIGKVLTTHPDVKKISFTGSTEVGKILMGQGAGTVKKVSLELGGNAPFIVFESADLEKAADGAIICKFRNAGQTCVCANRIYVQDGVYEKFAEIFARKVEALKIGAGSAPGVQVGPLINEQGLEKVEQHVRDALDRGGKLVCGGKADAAGPLFYQPTLITEMTPEMLVKKEETFGPVAGLFRFRDEKDAVAQANDTQYGLAAYFYTSDLGQAFRVSEALEYGMVAVNEAVVSTESAPFGGIKESGIGREGSKYGIEDYTDIKYVLVGGLGEI